jgi:hypothetical protein
VIIAIGSHCRKAGKTSLICALIRAIPEARWTVVKISGHQHGSDAPFALTGESDATGPHDTSRYLGAGAGKSFWLRARPDCLAGAIPALREILDRSGNAIIESSRVLEFIDPDLYLFVANDSAPEFKASARAHLLRADAIVTGMPSAELVELIRSRLCT